VCPFDDDDDLLSVKPRAIALWHEHQKLLGERDALNTRVQTLDSERDVLQARVAELERQVKNHTKKRFGNSTERNAATPSVPSASAPAPSAQTDTPSQADVPAKENAARGTREQPHLVTEEKPLFLSEDEQTCTVCGEKLEVWTGQTEDSPEIDVHVKGYVRRLYKRQKYRCRCGECIKTAPLPERLKEGNLYSIDFGVQAAFDKYVMHLPLSRQVEAMAMAGLVMDTQTLWAQVDTIAFWCIGAYEAIHTYVLSHSVIGADETTWRVMANGAPEQKEGTEKWWIWLACVPDAVVYTFEDNRSAKAAEKLLRGYHGVVMCDGYVAYISLAKDHPEVILAHCWSHIRRDYIELQESAPGVGSEMIRLIDELFRIEREHSPKGPDALLNARKEQSVAVLETIANKALEIGLSNSPGSRVFTITKTLVNQWEGLVRFVHDVRIPIHNNASEQSARSPVLGRKNHQGSRSKRGTQVSAILYTLVESAERSGVDPRAYLKLVVLRALRGQEPVIPCDVTSAMLVQECGMDEPMAKVAVQR
jgi:transposase